MIIERMACMARYFHDHKSARFADQFGAFPMNEQNKSRSFASPDSGSREKGRKVLETRLTENG
jgi:hypothetical protein